jgi:plastocyanin
VRAGTNERRGHLDINAFLPDSLMITAGDTVVWYVDHVQPHTVTFPSAAGERPELVSVQLPDGRLVPAPMPGQEPPPDVLAALADPANPPRLVLTGAVQSRPSPAHDGRSIYNSGLIGEHPLVTYPMEKTWALTFGTPGVYQYDCALHQPQGMKGTVTVTAR